MPMIHEKKAETSVGQEGISERWCGYIIRVCYVAVGINTVILVAAWSIYLYLGGPTNPVDYWSRYIIIPTLCMLFLNVLADCLVRSRRVPLIAKKYFSLLLALLFCAFLCVVHSILAVLLVTFVIPVFLSTIFADLRITRRIFILSLSAQLLSGIKMRVASTRDFGIWIWVELLVATGILIFSYFCAGILIRNGQYNLASLAQSIHERKRLEHQLQQDGRTGLYNRNTFEEFGKKMITECRASGIPLSFAMLDLDDFKKINDTYGHTAGDKVLLRLSRILLNNSDESICAFRLGGEEFGLLMKGYRIQDARQVCEGIRSLIGSSPAPEAGDQKITFSCGIVSLDETLPDLTSLYKAADSTMYRAKGKGKNRIELLDGPVPGEPFHTKKETAGGP